MTFLRTVVLSAAISLALPAVVLAQGDKAAPPKPKHETQAQLQQEAKVSLTDATATAQKAVPGGKITSHELEREKGKLIYSFDIKIAGKPGTEEVNVDAMTGAMIEKVHESAADEAKESAKDKKNPPAKKP